MTARTEAFSNSDNLIADVHLAPATMSSAKRVKLSHSKAPGPFRKPSSGDRAAAKVLTKKITQAPKAAAPIKQKAREAEEDDDDDEDDEDEEDEEQNDDSSDEASENDDSTPTVEEATKEGQTELPSKEETPTKSFRDLGIVDPLCEACEALKFKKPTPIQEQAIPLALQGRDVIGIAETGSGKTAAFALPILQSLLEKPQPLFGLVLAPTRELAAQIGQTFEALGASISLRCAVVVGGLDMVSQSIALGKKPHIVVATPGRLLDHLEKTKGFSLRSLKFLVMDEADRLLDLDFGPILDKILKFLPRERRTFLFSATMSSKVESLQRASLRDPLKVSVSSSQEKTVSTLIQNPLFIPHKHKDVYLIYLANEFAGKTTIVFTRTVNEAQRVSILLRTLSFGAIPLHGQLSQSMRLGALNKFKARSRDILVATDVAARGLDIPEVDLVINFDMPQDSMTYIHRVGRTARAGRSGRAISIITQYDLELWLRIEKAALNGRKLPLFQPDKEEVMVFKERVEEAQRHAREEMKALHEDRGKKGAVLKGRKRGSATKRRHDDMDAEEG
ncbi:ribosomal RNA processing protein [Pyricularia oryzae]|nr:ribosomal RNA processing protein [Pyricularia oryzae]KAI6525213.1 ribosomal RNA processing protein [Pyricularia oryzae]